jgi:hypothetical protein
MTQPFGEDLWKNVQAVRLSADGGIEAPVRVDGDQGIRIGVDAIATQHDAVPASGKTLGRLRARVRRLTKRDG